MADAALACSRRAFLSSTAAATAVAASSGTVAAQATHTVDMTGDLTFEPDALTVSAGDTVVWENVSQTGHTVTAYADGIPAEADYFASGGFATEQAARSAYPDGDIGGGATFEHTFSVPGTHEYFCVPHEGVGMTGTVEVEPAEARPTPGTGRPVLPASPVTGVVLAGLAVVAAAVTWFTVFANGGE